MCISLNKQLSFVISVLCLLPADHAGHRQRRPVRSVHGRPLQHRLPRVVRAGGRRAVSSLRRSVARLHHVQQAQHHQGKGSRVFSSDMYEEHCLMFCLIDWAVWMPSTRGYPQWLLNSYREPTLWDSSQLIRCSVWALLKGIEQCSCGAPNFSCCTIQVHCFAMTDRGVIYQRTLKSCLL